jgi:hypothetical protein
VLAELQLFLHSRGATVCLCNVLAELQLFLHSRGVIVCLCNVLAQLQLFLHSRGATVCLPRDSKARLCNKCHNNLSGNSQQGERPGDRLYVRGSSYTVL